MKWWYFPVQIYQSSGTKKWKFQTPQSRTPPPISVEFQIPLFIHFLQTKPFPPGERRPIWLKKLKTSMQLRKPVKPVRPKKLRKWQIHTFVLQSYTSSKQLYKLGTGHSSVELLITWSRGFLNTNFVNYYSSWGGLLDDAAVFESLLPPSGKSPGPSSCKQPLTYVPVSNHNKFFSSTSQRWMEYSTLASRWYPINDEQAFVNIFPRKAMQCSIKLNFNWFSQRWKG